MPSVYALDSFALLAYLEGEAGMSRVTALLDRARKDNAQLYLSLINFGEVLYITERERGLTKAQQVLAAMEQLPITIVSVSRDLVLAAAHIKAHHAMSYADAFAVAVAQTYGAVLVTGDPEFRSVDDIIDIEWLPRHR